MSNYLTIDGLKNFSLLPEAPLRPVARGICHICHMVNPVLVVHGSILCNSIQPNPSANWPSPTQFNPLQVKIFGPNPTQTNTTKHRAYSSVVTYFYTRNSHRTFSHYRFITPSDRFPVPVISAVKSNLTAWCSQILSNRALNALTWSFQFFFILLL